VSAGFEPDPQINDLMHYQNALYVGPDGQGASKTCDQAIAGQRRRARKLKVLWRPLIAPQSEQRRALHPPGAPIPLVRM
jgi:hypothetical protein